MTVRELMEALEPLDPNCKVLVPQTMQGMGTRVAPLEQVLKEGGEGRVMLCPETVTIGR